MLKNYYHKFLLVIIHAVLNINHIKLLFSTNYVLELGAFKQIRLIIAFGFNKLHFIQNV